MNRHTPHVIVFGEQKYGGLELPDLYTDQGYGQLKLLVAHLKMKDEIGDLILIAISHLQIHIGSATPFFALPYPAYNKWIPNNWLTSIWKHTHQLTIVVEVEKHWTLGLSRQHDKFTMDEILTYNFSSQQLILYKQLSPISAGNTNIRYYHSRWEVYPFLSTERSSTEEQA